MSAKDFIDLVDKFKFISYVGLEDTSDRMSFMVSVTLLMISSIIVTFKTYVFQPLACYVPSLPSGLKFDEYVENYCWVEGTYALRPNDTLPSTPMEWKQMEHLKMEYYQWVPFILALQCVLFYLPRVLWQTFCYNKIGVDLESLLQQANKARDDDKCDDKCKIITEKIEALLFCHRDYRQGTVSDFRRKMYGYFGFIIASKRMGTWLVFWYFIMKLAYLANAIGQMVLIAKFFETTKNFLMFGNEIVHTILLGQDWSHTTAFPRVTNCYIDDIRGVSSRLNYHAQCSLPQNMLNEKLFLFLWFWVSIVALTTFLSIFLWLKRVTFYNRVQFIKNLLKNNDFYHTNKRGTLHKFVNDFLQHDGFFIIHMIYLSCGDIVTTTIVTQLFKLYDHKYKDVDMKRDRYYLIENEGMAMKLTPAIGTSAKKYPSAPQDTVIQFV